MMMMMTVVAMLMAGMSTTSRQSQLLSTPTTKHMEIMTININYTKLYYLELINIISGITAIKLFACSTNVRPPHLNTRQHETERGVCIYK